MPQIIERPVPPGRSPPRLDSIFENYRNCRSGAGENLFNAGPLPWPQAECAPGNYWHPGKRPGKLEKSAGTARPAGSRRAGPNARLLRLARTSRGTSRRTIAAQRARSHPQAGSQRGRYVAKRRVTVAANFSSRSVHAQPVASRGTFRIDALHSPTRQILQAVLLLRGALLSPRSIEQQTEKLRGFCASALVVSRVKIQFLVVGLQMETRGRDTGKICMNKLPSPFTTPAELHTIIPAGHSRVCIKRRAEPV